MLRVERNLKGLNDQLQRFVSYKFKLAEPYSLLRDINEESNEVQSSIPS